MKSPGGDADSMLGLTKFGDGSKLDMNDFMDGESSFIYIVSGYKDQTLFSTERLDMTRGVWERRADVNIARTKFGVVQ